MRPHLLLVFKDKVQGFDKNAILFLQPFRQTAFVSLEIF